MDDRVSRRRFIKIAGSLAIAAGISIVGLQQLFSKDNGIYPARQIRDNPFTSNGKSLVSEIKTDSEVDVEKLVRESIESIGGIERIVSSGNKVVIKPACFSTNPDCAPDARVVAAISKLAKDAGGSVIVAESSGSGDTAHNLTSVGITTAAENVGVEVKALPSEESIFMKVPRGVLLGDVETFKTIYDCDVLISVPRLKRHGSATVTISLKNMMGTMTPREMGRFHETGLSQCIADLNTVMKPDLTIVDAIYAMARTGPLHGDMIKMNTVFASGDPVAVDRLSSQRLHELELRHNKLTFNPENVAHIRAASDLGIGSDNFGQITIVEKNI